MNLKDTFIKSIKNKFDKVIGAYVDENKNFFCAYLKKIDDKWKIIEVSESEIINAEKNLSEVVAESINNLRRIKNWSADSIAFCLTNDKVVTDFDDLSIIPKDKISNAVHYQIAATGNFETDQYLSSFMEIDPDVWMEGILKEEVNKWTESFAKNKLKLLALTAMPNLIKTVEDFDLTEVDEKFLKRGGLKAIFAAKILINQSKPNFLFERTTNLNDWNFKLISAIIIFVTIISLIAMIGYNYFNYVQAQNELQFQRKRIKSLEKDRRKIEFMIQIQNELKKKNQYLAELTEKIFPYRSLLIHFGTIKIKGVWLKELQTLDENLIEIKGEAINYESVANYIKVLENDREIFTKVELRNSQQGEKFVQFTINLTI